MTHKESKLFRLYAADFDMANAMFCMYWCVEDWDFDTAMYHQLMYLQALDEWNDLMNSTSIRTQEKYFEFEMTARGL